MAYQIPTFSDNFTCPECGGCTRVRDSRPSRQVKNAVRRRRHCVNGHRFTTVEVAGAVPQFSDICTALALLPKTDIALVRVLIFRLSDGATLEPETAPGPLELANA